jgi:hypothetical protein
VRELLGKGACRGMIRSKRRGLGERIELCQGGWVTGNIMHVWQFHARNLQIIEPTERKSSVIERPRTMSMKRAPTLSSPSPFGRTLPSAISRRVTKSSASSANSEMLLKMIWTSSRVMGGPSKVVDEPEAVESVRMDDEDDSGGVGIGGSLPEGWGCGRGVVRNGVCPGKKR